MFKTRFVRLGVMALGVLGLLGVGTPSAEATTVSTITFQGTATLDGPLGYPCATNPPSVPPNAKCPDPTLILFTKPLPLPDGTDNGSLPYVHGGNTRAFVFGADLCLNAVYNHNKLDKDTLHVTGVDAACSITATGTVTGWCGLSTGLGTATFTDALGQVYTVDRFHFYGVGSTLFINGHWRKVSNTPSQTGLLTGVVNATPLPEPGLTGPTTLGNSCAGKTADTFDISGALAAAGV